MAFAIFVLIHKNSLEKGEKEARELLIGKLQSKFNKISEMLHSLANDSNGETVANTKETAAKILQNKEKIINELKALNILTPRDIISLVSPVMIA